MMYIHVSKYKKITNIHQASLNNVFIMQSNFQFHILGTKKKKLESKKIRSQIKTTVKSKNSKRKLAKRKKKSTRNENKKQSKCRN